MKIELGRRYKRRDGVITGPIVFIDYPFRETDTGGSYSESGAYYSTANHPFDLIEEYVEPKRVEVWAAIDIIAGGPVILNTASSADYLREYYNTYPDIKIIKLREVEE
jgi:hypothetical protein